MPEPLTVTDTERSRPRGLIERVVDALDRVIGRGAGGLRR
jgi:hypothetical protein